MTRLFGIDETEIHKLGRDNILFMTLVRESLRFDRPPSRQYLSVLNQLSFLFAMYVNKPERDHVQIFASSVYVVKAPVY